MITLKTKKYGKKQSILFLSLYEWIFIDQEIYFIEEIIRVYSSDIKDVINMDWTAHALLEYFWS